MLLQGDHSFKLIPTPLATVHSELSKVEGLLDGRAWPAAVARHTTAFRIMDRGNSAGPAVLPWLHDVLVYPQ